MPTPVPRKRKRSPNPKPTSSRTSPPPPPTTSTPSSILNSPRHRATATHVFFHSGVLSNWHPSPTRFRGKEGLEICLPRLDELGISHPSPESYSTLLIQEFGFGRGEQWMMAMKAWLFECGIDDSGSRMFQRTGTVEDEEFRDFQRDVLSKSGPPPESASASSSTGSDEKEQAWAARLPTILRTNVPRTQKALGRKVLGFRQDVWNAASVPIMMAGCVIRAQADPELKSLYVAASGRTFVEGAPRDRIWGVGLKWDSKAIEDEKNWRGENRLGKCHGEAAALIRGVEGDGNDRLDG
ncbi:hypothetical protein N7474_010843 [Penicillium riverlandense]|uniref:uncharacterized protein n=1 Tax=Penicillium riverlandense TaxID=1903569 RepID=UPI002546E38E|nr:uncharacterized protein N7474_010843 [Penicillium riverlandense]KAJ5804956.1 hypothetical protein N7474_010843 [Penicillium riverlandense]